MAIIDEMKRRAKRASFEAERVVRINRAQSRIAALQGQLSAGITRLGYLTYDLAGRGEVEHPQLRQFCMQLDQLRAQIAATEEGIRAIQTEAFMEEPTQVTCPSCGTACPVQARFCQNCGAPLARAVPSSPPSAGPVCPACGTRNPAGMRFCIQCGQRLAALDASISQETSRPPGVPPRDAARSVAASDAMDAMPPISSATPADAPAVAPETAAGMPATKSNGAVVAPAPAPSSPVRDGADGADASGDVGPTAQSTTVEKHCATCGEVAPDDALFCVGCGQSLAQP